MTGTSKPTVGGAVKALADEGVLRAQRGAYGGLIVVGDNIPVALMARASGWREAIITELLEARRPVEMELALLAGQRATEDDLDIMRSAVDQLKQARHERDRVRWLHLDHLFHYSLGRAARSEMLAYYQHQILEQLAVHLRDYYEQHEDPDWVLETHFETLSAVESRDSERIRLAMGRHLMGLEKVAAVQQLGRGRQARSSLSSGVQLISGGTPDSPTSGRRARESVPRPSRPRPRGRKRS